MSVNLLPQVTETELKKVDSSIKGFIGLIVWAGIMIVIFVVLFFNRGLETGNTKELETSKLSLLNRIQGLGQLQYDFYTLAYKTQVLENISTEQYTPSVISKYIDSKIDNKTKIKNYNFDSTGAINIQLESDSYITAVRVWNALLEDKKVITELNLNSFGSAEDGKVQFQLRGNLNLEELYAENGRK
jgi:hypothetical protein